MIPVNFDYHKLLDWTTHNTVLHESADAGGVETWRMTIT